MSETLSAEELANTVNERIAQALETEKSPAERG